MQIVKFGKVLHIIALVLVLLLVLCCFLANSRSVQRKAAELVSNVAQKATGTDVSAGSVRFVYPFGIEIEELTLYDMQNDTLLHAGQATLHFKPVKLLKKELVISSVKLIRPDIRLYTDSIGGTSNFAFLLNKEKKSDSPSELNIQAKSIIVKNASMRYDVLDMPQTPGLFNRNHLAVTGLNTGLSLKVLNSDTLSLMIRNLSAKEHSGLELVSGKGALSAGAHSIKATGLEFKTPSGSIEISELTAGCGMKEFGNGIPDFKANVRTTLSGSDFAPFYPQASGMGPATVSFRASGDSGRISIDNLLLNSGYAIQARGNAAIELDSLNGISNAYANLTADVNKGFSKWFDRTFSGFGLELPDRLNGLDGSTISAHARKEGQDMKANMSIKSEMGNIAAQAQGKDGRYTAHTEAENVRLDTILGTGIFGACSLVADAELKNDSTGMSGTATMKSGKVNIGGYSYNGIDAKVTFAGNNISAAVNYSDKNGSISATGGTTGKNNGSYWAKLDADNVNLWEFSRGKLDSLTVSGIFEANVDGSDIDFMDGRLSIENLSVRRPDGRSWEAGNLDACLSGNGSNDTRAITIRSDFLNASMLGDYRLSSLYNSMTELVEPMFPIMESIQANKSNGTKKHDNNLVLKANVSNLDFMDVIFNRPLYLNGETVIDVDLCDKSGTMTAGISVPGATIGQNMISDASVSIGISGDSLKTDIAGHYATQGMDASLNSRLLASADMPDMIKADLYLNDTKTQSSIPAHTSIHLFEDGNNHLGADILMQPTTLTYNGNTWNLSLDSLQMVGGNIDISRLLLKGESQQLAANGTISADSTRTLELNFEHMDIYETMLLFSKKEPDLKGTASGELQLAGILGKPAFDGNLAIDDFEFSGSLFGDLETQLNWDQELSLIDISGSAKDSINGAVTGLSGFFRPDDSYLDMTINANHTDIGFLSKWTSSIFSDIGGRTTGRIRIFGPLSELDLDGSTVLEDANLDIASIGAGFIIRHDVIQFQPGKILFSNINLFDPKGHDGLMDCTLTHNHFHEWNVDLNASVTDMLVLNMPESEKSSIFATVYAEGDVSMRFDETNGIDLKVDARTANGTRFGFKPTDSDTEDYGFLTIVDRAALASEFENTGTISLASTVPAKKTGLNLDLNIQCDNSAVMDLSLGSITGLMRGQGNIQVKYGSIDGLVLNGLYNLSYGQCSLSLEDLIRKDFMLGEGSYVRFNGSPMDTELNLMTYHNVNSVSIYDLDPSVSTSSNVRVRCLMDVTGTAGEPKLSFDVDMPSGTSQEKDILASATATDEQRNIQFMYLLAIGRFYSYDFGNGLSNNMSPSTMESILNSAVSGQVNNVLSSILGSENISLSSNLSASSYLSNDATNLNNRELEGILEAHLLDNRLLVNGNFGYRENTINNTSSFIGDVEARYLLFPRYGISLKGYNKSNDKYFSKTTLTTQGIGLVFERDF